MMAPGQRILWKIQAYILLNAYYLHVQPLEAYLFSNYDVFVQGYWKKGLQHKEMATTSFFGEKPTSAKLFLVLTLTLPGVSLTFTQYEIFIRLMIMSIKIDFGEILLRANVTSDNLCSAKIKMFLLPPCARVFWLVITLHQILIKFLGSYLTEKREKTESPQGSRQVTPKVSRKK